ncbi:hypothetical protein AB1460_28885 [Parafrankia sp. FMc2]
MVVAAEGAEGAVYLFVGGPGGEFAGVDTGEELADGHASQGEG